MERALAVARLIEPSLRDMARLMSEMGRKAVDCTALAIDSYLEGGDSVLRVKAMSDDIRLGYYRLEDLTFDTLLRFQPAAEEFRLIRSATEIAYAFSRFGRYAFDIALVRAKFGDLSGCDKRWLYEVANEVKGMTADAVLSFAELDTGRAARIRAREDFVDRVYRRRIPDLVGSPSTPCALSEALVLLYLERIADHAVFMSGSVDYIVNGRGGGGGAARDAPGAAGRERVAGRLPMV